MMHKLIEALESRLLLNAADVDSTFGIGGGTVTAFSGPGEAYSMAEALQPDGKLVVVGFTQQIGYRLAVARYNPDGSTDSSFGAGGSESLSFSPFDQGYAVAITGDGKIVIGGITQVGTSATGNQYEFALWQLNSNGSLDTSFNGTGEQRVSLNMNLGNPSCGVAAQDDGKVILAGTVIVNNIRQVAAVRFNPDGTMDPTFGTGGQAITATSTGLEASAVAIDSDGRVLVAGTTAPSSSGTNPYTTQFAVARFTPGGVLDGSFGTGGIVATALSRNDSASAIVVQPDGKIVLGGISYNGTYNYMGVARYNTDGTLDTSFAGSGHELIGDGVNNDRALGVALTSTGGIVLAGDNGTDVLVALLTPSGSVDSSFNGSGHALGSWADGRAVLVRGNGSITVAATTGNTFVVDQFTSAGQPDAGFGTDGVVRTDIVSPALAYASGVALQPDGKVVAVGRISTTIRSDSIIARYTTAGAADASFGTNGLLVAAWGSGNSYATSVAVQPDGDVIVAGTAIDPSTNQREPIVTRYLPDGTLDTNFGPGGEVFVGAQRLGIGSGASSAYVALQPDGKILLAGNGAPGFFGVARLLPTGQLDTTYGNGGITYLNLSVKVSASGVAIDTSGRLIVSTGGGPWDVLVRLTANGAVDPTFGANGVESTYLNGVDAANALALTPDGHILVGGSVNNGTNDDFKLARFNSDGSLDPTFGTGGTVQTNLGANDLIQSVRVLADGSILAAGSSGSALALANYTASGALQPSFGNGGIAVITFGNPGVAANAILVRPNGRIVVAGVDANSFMVGQFVGSAPDVVADTPGNDTLQLRRDSDGQHIDWSMELETGQIPADDPNGLTLNSDGGNDTIALDNSQPNPLPASLHLNGTFTMTGLQSLAGTTLDLGRSTLFVNYAGSSDPLAMIQQALKTGYKGGTWNGVASSTTGAIVTSAGSSTYGIGYADFADGSGVNLNAGTIELKYTVNADANLDGSVSLADFLLLARHFGQANGWDAGDFNYDFSVNLSDLLALTRDFGKALPPASMSASILPSDPSDIARRRRTAML